MTTTAARVVAGTPKPNGAIFRAPAGTALPVDESTALAGPFESQGYVSNDGLSRAINRAFEQIREWGGLEVKRLKTEVSVTLDFTLIEASNGEVAKTVWGEDAVTITPATSGAGGKLAVAFKGDDPAPSVWAIDMKDGNALRRIAAANAQITTEDFTQEFTNSSVISYPVTLTLFPDEDGVFFYEYSDDGIKAAA